MPFKILFSLFFLLSITGCLHKATIPHTDSISMESRSVVAPPPSPVADISRPKKEIPEPKLPPKEIQSGTLTAGDIDDNLNLNDFQKYVNRTLQKNKESPLPFISTQKRFKLKVQDASGKGINRMEVTFGDSTRYTNSTGVIHLFPSLDEVQMIDSLTVNNKTIPIDFNNDTEKTITLQATAFGSRSLDLMFVIDTTGSMSDEMKYLAKEFESIISNIEAKYPDVKIRFGLTLYRDKGDDYVVKNFDFTDSKQTMQEQLNDQSANGGGDYPEAMEQGIQKGLEASWRATDGVRMMFLVADAPPHDEDMQKILPLIKKARDKAIHVYPIAASGVAEKAEFIMRHLAIFTEGRHLFLTDDSGVGNSHEEPKVACYQVTRLDQLIRRVIQSELSGERVEATKDETIRSVGNYQNGVCTTEKEDSANN